MRFICFSAWAVVVLAITACTPKIIPASPMASAHIVTRLQVQPTQLSMAELAGFALTVNALNQGDQHTDPQLMSATLLVNGVASEVFAEAVSNGIREAAWSALPPGKEAALTWSLGYSLFEKPGTYQLVLDWHGLHDAVVVTVTP